MAEGIVEHQSGYPLPQTEQERQGRNQEHWTEGPLLNTAHMVRDGALMSVVVSTYLLVLLRFNPRLFLRHYPKEIQDVVPPKSKREVKISILLGAPLGLFCLGYILVSALRWRTSGPVNPSFLELFEYAFGVLFFFNLVDLLLLDWLIVCWYAPNWVTLPGTEHIVISKPYFHHFKGFLAGTVFSLIGGFLIAALLSFVF